MRCVRTAEFNVVLYRIRKKVYILEYHAYLIHERFQCVITHIRSENLLNFLIAAAVVLKSIFQLFSPFPIRLKDLITLMP